MGLTWGQIDLKERFIRLLADDTKTKEPRLIPIYRKLVELLKHMPATLGGVPMPAVKVFTYAGRSVSSIKKGFSSACKRAGIEGCTFHDLRPAAINNCRLQGHDYFRIMAASGHKTMSVFKRYNAVSVEELRSLAEV